MYYDDGDGYDWDREEADYQQAEAEAAGREYSRGVRRMKALRAAGKLAEAAEACPHGGGYPLASIAASEGTTSAGVDPRAGQAGVRCSDCGSVLSDWPLRLRPLLSYSDPQIPDAEAVVWYPCEGRLVAGEFVRRLVPTLFAVPALRRRARGGVNVRVVRCVRQRSACDVRVR